MWQHVAAVGAAAMVEAVNYGNVKADIGAGAMTLAWVGFTLSSAVAFGIAIMIISIMVLDRLAD
jgi:hypothetical protein